MYEGAKSAGKKPKKTYTVRWTVEGKEHQQTFATRALADAERSKLMGYLREGMAFDIATGLPEVTLREARKRPWLEHACQYVDMKWPAAAPKSRTGMAETLATVMPALLRERAGRPPAEVIRATLYGWAFVAPARTECDPTSEQAAAMEWMMRNCVDIAELDHPDTGAMLVRRALDLLATLLDGSTAAAKTVSRKRAVFYNCLEYAVELGYLTGNPIDRIKWTAPKLAEAVDDRVVVNHQQATALLSAVALLPGVARRLVAMFAVMYYAALRPSEALDLREENIASLPDEGWGELVLTNSSPRTGTAWTDSGRSRERRELKHRARTETRRVPLHPLAVGILRTHIGLFGIAPDGRLFVGPRGGTIGDSTYGDLWQRAREIALTAAEARSPLAGRPYDLRHAAVSTWLNAGVSPAQVAEWAGHSVAVLLRVYAKCISGGEGAARRRVEDSMG
ncbi:tyrosine-type recombinase/integrase [Catellatospora citrea]|uniref:tyrosine-type recombinase/integrase n=1 Tax=Catellatospora citrea TaxID=53366 RepID=UPI001EF3A812|nr:tyrosine-type recombinase/integrase [Catellatospora citrea]